MPGHDVHLIALDLAAELDHGLALHDPLTESGRHHLGVIGIDPQLPGDLLVGEVQAREVEAQDPDSQRLVMPREDRVGQVVEPLATAVAAAPLALDLDVVVTVLGDLGTPTPGAPHAVGSAHCPDSPEALGVVNEGLDVNHRRGTTSNGSRAIRCLDPS